MSCGCEHSIVLREHFLISSRGVDFYNNNNIAFEFKETHSKKLNNIFFKIPKYQLDESDYVVFFVHFAENFKYFVHSSNYIKRRYSCKNTSKTAHVRIQIVKRNYIAKFKDMDILGLYLELIKE